MNAVDVREVRKTFGSFTLENISFRVAPGEAVGLFGPNGSGKSTIFNILAGLVRPSSGEVRFLEKYAPGDEHLKGIIAAVRDENYLAEDISVKKYFRSVCGFYDAWDKAVMDEYLDRFGIDRSLKVKELSKGNKLKLSLITAISHGAGILLLDEPFSGIDHSSKLQFQSVIAEMLKNNSSVIISSHDLNDLTKLCSRILFINTGRILLNSSGEEAEMNWKKIQESLKEVS